MDAFLISDDVYFSQGLQSYFKTEQRVLTPLPWSLYTPAYNRRHFKQGDMLVLDASTNRFVEKSIIFPIDNCKLTVLILCTPAVCLPPVFRNYPRAARNLTASHLLKIIDTVQATATESKYCPGSLTAQESFILKRIYEQATHQEISRELAISQKTVSTHKINALKKLGVRTLSQLFCLNRQALASSAPANHAVAPDDTPQPASCTSLTSARHLPASMP